MQVAFKTKKFGDHAERRTFSKIKNTLELTDLLEIQKKSYQWFLDEGIKESIDDLMKKLEKLSGVSKVEIIGQA